MLSQRFLTARLAHIAHVQQIRNKFIASKRPTGPARPENEDDKLFFVCVGLGLWTFVEAIFFFNNRHTEVPLYGNTVDCEDNCDCPPCKYHKQN